MSSSSIEFIPGRKKGSRNVLYDGHLYHLNRKKDEKTYWKCNKCKSRVTLVQDTFRAATPRPSWPRSSTIGTTSTPPLYSHDSWNHHEASQMLLPRSSNVAEGWNNGFASLVNCHNPSIWKFLDCIKREQALTDVKITNILTRRPFKRAAKWEKFDLEI